jgi:hypothetical protein
VPDIAFKWYGLRGLLANSKLLADRLDVDLQQTLRGLLAPTILEAKSRFSSLGGTGRRTAATVKGFVRQSSIGFQMGARGAEGVGFELGREFGAKPPGQSTKRRSPHTYFVRTPAGYRRAERTIDYSDPDIFGPWTGNQFQPELHGPEGVSGHAFYPSIARSYEELQRKIVDVLEDGFNAMMREVDE